MTDMLLTGQESHRLRFRKLMASDFDAWLPFHQNSLSTQYWFGEDPDPQIACKNWFDRVFHRYENQLGGLNVLQCKQTGDFIGQCGLLIQMVDGIQELEIGYSILPKFWRQGYAAEAAKKCKDFAFSHEFSDSLISIIHKDNMPSQKVAQAIGMQWDKTTVYKDNPTYIFRIRS